jgi:hypothetical protein
VHDLPADRDTSVVDGKAVESGGTGLSRRSVVRQLSVGSALAAAGLLASASPVSADTLDRTQPRRFRLAPPVTAESPGASLVNKGFVDQVREDLSTQITAIQSQVTSAASQSYVNTQVTAGVNQVRYFTENIRNSSYTLQLADATRVVAMSSATATTVTVPDNVSVPFPIGTIVNIYAANAQQVTVQGAQNVTVHNAGQLAGAHTEVSLRKRGTNEWVLSGNVI